MSGYRVVFEQVTRRTLEQLALDQKRQRHGTSCARPSSRPQPYSWGRGRRSGTGGAAKSTGSDDDGSSCQTGSYS
jgi:hypothetical protein